MPELPEVETTLRGIRPHITGLQISRVIIRNHQLRWPVPKQLPQLLQHNTIEWVQRRAKYLLLYTQTGTLIIHLGMSGSLRILPANIPAEKHDHVDIVFANQSCLRLRDPRRFGAVLWTSQDPLQHKLLNKIGPEPLNSTLSGDYLYRLSRNKKIAVKNFIMDSKVVVGVGNIYANEALFLAGILPTRPAGKVSKKRYLLLADSIKQVLTDAINKGGTTLRDFTASDGQPGYFRLHLNVYNQENKPCPKCKQPIKQVRLGQRSTFYCSKCQK
jgi:formamidopyrimidine-DNA glycosylase